MTSKEALNDLKWHTVPTDIGIGHQIKCEETIKKDLEVLEILKSKIGLIYIPIQPDIKQEKYILTGAEITKEEYQKFKEWLEE